MTTHNPPQAPLGAANGIVPSAVLLCTTSELLELANLVGAALRELDGEPMAAPADLAREAADITVPPVPTYSPLSGRKRMKQDVATSSGEYR